MIQTPNLSLIVWNLVSDPFSSEELAENFFKLDQHDHTSGRGARIKTGSIEDGSITYNKLSTGIFPASSAVASGSLNLTSSNQDVPDCVVQLTPSVSNTKALVIGSFDFTSSITDGTTICTGKLNVDTVVQDDVADFGITGTTSANPNSINGVVTQHWLIDSLNNTEHEFKLVASAVEDDASSGVCNSANITVLMVP